MIPRWNRCTTCKQCFGNWRYHRCMYNKYP